MANLEYGNNPDFRATFAQQPPRNGSDRPRGGGIGPRPDASIQDAREYWVRAKEARMKEILDPTHSALLVVDLQNDFLALDGKLAQAGGNIEPMRAVLPRIQEVTDLFYKMKRPVIRTITYEDLDLRTEAGLDRYFVTDEREVEEKDTIFFLKGTPGAELYVPSNPGDVVIEKSTLSAYPGTELHDVLEREGIKTVFIAGIKTQRCVRRTAEDLSDNERNLHVVVLEDCVATDDLLQHEAAMAEFKTFSIPVVNSTQLIEAWKAK